VGNQPKLTQKPNQKPADSDQKMNYTLAYDPGCEAGLNPKFKTQPSKLAATPPRMKTQILYWRFARRLATLAGMDSKRLEIKVGLFVLMGLVLMAVLLIQFSKGTSVFHGTYNVYLQADNVGGLKQRASVLLAGVVVGAVSDIVLAPDGKSVTITLKIYKNVVIYGDAHFVIEQAGFLGDQFVAIMPTDNKAPPLADGARVNCEPPFDLQQVARSVTGFIARVDETVKKIDDSVTKLQNTVLNDQTMTNLSETIANLRTASEEAVVAVNSLNSLVATNGSQVNLAVSNIVFFSTDLADVGDSAKGIVAKNGATISEAMTNIEQTTETLKQLGDDIKAGRGLAGAILENQQLATNMEATVNNLSIATSNLNALGLWDFLWHHEGEPARPNMPPSKYTSPHDSQRP
jgi:phospholipid/cholesterol/gamma-HCH transport system substrate-binding protein